MESPNKILRTRSRLILAIILFVALAARAAVPVGYMPGNLLAGEYMVMCPASSRAALAKIHHGDHGDSYTYLGDVCPIGSALAAAVPCSPPRAAVGGFSNGGAPSSMVEIVEPRSITCHFRSRAPPRA